MSRFLAALVFATFCRAQGPPALQGILNFEGGQAGTAPAGWGIKAAAVALDNQVFHEGKQSVRIERRTGDAGPFGGITALVAADFTGAIIELRGYLRCEDVTGRIGMWMQLADESGSLGFDTTEALQVKGTTDWTEYTVKLPMRKAGRRLSFGMFVFGTGRLWASGLQLLVDGKPLWDAPKAGRAETVIDRDHEFDRGSRISFRSLTPVQIENLATLGKVWGFLKYHHPLITSGQRHWDYELFRIFPAILAARDRAAANAALLQWIAALGEIAPCEPCATLRRDDLQLAPPLAWLDDQAMLGAGLSAALRKIHTNRNASGKQFYVSHVAGEGNPAFQNEPGYSGIDLPDAGYQLLALFRYWNIIQYWFPARDVIGEDWDGVLKQSLPGVALAKGRDAFQLAMMAVVARIHDSHAASMNAVLPPVGECQLPVKLRFVENQAVITGYATAGAGEVTPLKRGDVIVELDGVRVNKLVETWSPYYAASNEPARLRDIAHGMTKGECGMANLRVLRVGAEVAVKAVRVPIVGLNPPSFHDRSGDTYQRLSPEVAYIKLYSIKNADIPGYIKSASGTKGLIIDIRNYPSDFVTFTLGQLLVSEKTDFVRFTIGDLVNPGAFHWEIPPPLAPHMPHYSGKIVILVDEVSQSNAEYTAMAFRAAAGAKVMGSTTAGADGNVSRIPLPLGISTMISGIGVFYPDKRPTQRVGIVPDIEVKPTIEGIRAGRDEVLEAAIAEILKK